MSIGQIGMLAASAHHPGCGIYVEQVLVRFSGKPDPEIIRSAWLATVDAVPALRARLGADNSGYPRLFLEKSAKVDWKTDFTEDPDWLKSERKSNFKDPALPSRCCYRPQSGEWLWSFHHSMMDGRSIVIVLKNFLLRLAGQPAATNPIWCGGLAVDRSVSQHAREIWSSIAKPEEDEIEPLAWDGVPGAGGVPRYQRLPIPKAVLEALKKVSSELDTTTHNILQWAWGFTIGRVFARKNPVVGVVRSGHWAVEGRKEAAGYLMSTLPVPISYEPEITLGAA
ncbi:MAG: uncharacterized protein JWO82_1085, partial [Akkermansiaceae bacterium]|nr:uncharacterized protein [Akkermansiaceae bacterium]